MRRLIRILKVINRRTVIIDHIFSGIIATITGSWILMTLICLNHTSLWPALILTTAWTIAVYSVFIGKYAKQ